MPAVSQVQKAAERLVDDPRAVGELLASRLPGAPDQAALQALQDALRPGVPSGAAPTPAERARLEQALAALRERGGATPAQVPGERRDGPMQRTSAPPTYSWSPRSDPELSL